MSEKTQPEIGKFTKSLSAIQLKEPVSNYTSCSENKFDHTEMKIAFFSKGTIFLENSKLKFITESYEEYNFEEVECFAQLMSDDFEKLFKESVYFRCDSSPVRFSVNFYNKDNCKLGKLISDAIFRDIGHSRGKGLWVSCVFDN